MILTALMAHQRKLIRQAVVAQLIAAGTAAGARVIGTRTESHRKGQLPAVDVYALHEEVTPESAMTEPIELTRILKLEIVGSVAHSDSGTHVDDAMDDLAEQLEAAMASDYYISDTIVDQILESTEMEVIEEKESPLVGVIVLTYAITYRTQPATAELVDDFVTADVKQTVVGSVPSTVPAEDTFTVLETP